MPNISLPRTVKRSYWRTCVHDSKLKTTHTKMRENLCWGVFKWCQCVRLSIRDRSRHRLCAEENPLTHNNKRSLSNRGVFIKRHGNSKYLDLPQAEPASHARAMVYALWGSSWSRWSQMCSEQNIRRAVRRSIRPNRLWPWSYYAGHGAAGSTANVVVSILWKSRVPKPAYYRAIKSEKSLTGSGRRQKSDACRDLAPFKNLVKAQGAIPRQRTPCTFKRH